MPENQVYKMVGPVLLKQDQAEAKGNVDKRLEFIEGEMYVGLSCWPRRAELDDTG